MTGECRQILKHSGLTSDRIYPMNCAFYPYSAQFLDTQDIFLYGQQDYEMMWKKIVNNIEKIQVHKYWIMEGVPCEICRKPSMEIGILFKDYSIMGFHLDCIKKHKDFDIKQSFCVWVLKESK